jgi:hypothetical protein
MRVEEINVKECGESVTAVKKKQLSLQKINVLLRIQEFFGCYLNMFFVLMAVNLSDGTLHLNLSLRAVGQTSAAASSLKGAASNVR